MQIIVHIGQQKTASTAIQNQLARNRKRLASQGVLFPRALGETRSRLIKDIISRDPAMIPFREIILHNLSSELSSGSGKCILSEENLFNTPSNSSLESMSSHKETLIRLKDVFRNYATSWRILCYVRRADEHFPSLYQQNVKGGFALTFDSAFEERLHSGYYYYSRHIEQWAQVFGEKSVEVRLFNRKTLNGSPLEDFAQWLGLDLEGASLERQAPANESFDRLNTEILRFLNLCEIEQPDLLLKHDLRRVRPRLRVLDTGDRLRLDTERANRLQDQFREDHERLAERYLSPEQAAVLLAPPAESPPQPPLDRHALFERMMALFSDPDLARLAVDKVEQSINQRAPGYPRITREAHAQRIIEQFNQRH